jgi:putative endonuclease
MFVYIIYSPSTDRFYIGSTQDLQKRLAIHNTGGYKGSSTHFANDWELFHTIKCESRSQALQIEMHIKRMRNRKYYENIKTYPEISHKLLEKYK